MTSDAQPETTPDETYDVIVIGGGPVGENAADRASRTGLSVALVEAELVGGECSYWACMPSKTLLRPGAVRAEARGVPGVTVGDDLDVAAVLARRDQMVSDWDDSGQVSWVEGAGLTLVRGLGRIVGPRLVEVVAEEPDADPDDLPRTRRLAARRAVIVATGSVPVLPDVPGLADANPWTSREATAVEDVPESLAIVGGGVVATEMAVAFADLGARVTVLSRGGLLGRTEPWAGEAVAASLRELGVDVRLGVATESVEPLPDGGVRLVLAAAGPADGEDAPDLSPVTAERVLVATGRVPRTQDLGVDSVGLAPGRALEVDDTMLVQGLGAEAGTGWLYAAGDVTGRVATTHQGKYQGRVAGDVVAARFGDPDADGAPTAGERRPPSAPGPSRGRGSPRRPTPWPRPRSCSPVPRWRPSGTPRRPRATRASTCASCATTSRTSPAPRCAPRTTRAARSSSSTPRARSSSAPRSSARTRPRCCTPRRSPSWARCRCAGCGTPCRRTRP